MADPTPPFRFGLIGTGGIAATHAAALDESDRATLVAASGGRRAAAFCAQHGCGHEADPEALLDRGDLDGVILCTPSGVRRGLTVAAAERGLHVLVEKPLEVSVARGRAMIEACEAHGATLGVIFQSRFAPGVEAAAEAIHAGRLGAPVLGEVQVAWHRPPAYYDSAAWRGTWSLDGGGALMNQGIHAVDQLLWLLGEATEVSARATRRRHEGIEVEDTLVAHVTFASGALATMAVSTACAPGWDRRTEACGTEGSLRLVDDRLTVWQPADGRPAPAEAMAPEGGETGAGSPGPTLSDFTLHQRQIEDFVDAVRAGRPPRVDGREGLRSLELVTAAYRSAHDGVAVRLGHGGDGAAPTEAAAP
jgi:predicted dehydrogenase